VEAAFDIYLMQFDGDRWYPSPPIGWPMVLALGEFFGLAWLVNPVLGGLNIILIYLLLAHLYSSRLARISILLLGISPWYVFMAMNFMTHMFTLTCGLVSALGLVWVRETGKTRWVLLAGIALGVMSLIRPLEALIWAVLLGIWALGIGGKRLKLSWLAAFVITTGLVASLVLPYNKLLTGSAVTFPINLHTDQRFGPNSNAYGFGPDRGMGWPIDPNLGHDPVDALINTSLNGFSMNIELFGWSTGSFLFAILFLISGSYRKSDYLMLAVILAVFAAFFFYYFSGGPDFGARYWFLMIVPLVALSVRGIQYLEGKLDDRLPGNSALVLSMVLVLGVMALVNYFPWRAIDKYYHYLNMRPDIRELAEEYNFGRSLVLISGNEHPDYASAFVYNPIDMQADAPIYAWDQSEDVRRQVVSAYLDRPVWFVNGPTVTQAGYEIVAGPISGEQVINKTFYVSK
jgi:4-amino-4-deoxy-L-arabinose transferase-like glycosyltransferase